ncbi:diacylglycerol/lipid kinase family protein [Facklamia miroungae]|uniref:Lipid kinase, YegS/Rv2252/BmrU family n=1 Tax=Facklamia miroungae TaxID=120956 RepID=A0A1G7QYC8_9LACT|nr:diacylglycerol kinase family protein [Facklamia miroungae]NKZ29111.1 diacylglycerol kinase family lipid kinase [Facklamia miroungae]SDG03542.1 lipid kinase, YegS/Rv2252/BmrU family [Facklamia miroungae]
MKKILIIANPGSGKGKAVSYAEQLAEVLIESYNVEIEQRVTEKPQDAYEWAKTTSSKDRDTIICLGGDGTVNEVISGLMQNQHPPHFAFLPLGTVNDLARSLGISLNPEKAIQQFRFLEQKKLDVGQVNDQYFVNVLALGAIPSAVLETESKIKNKIGSLAYFFDGVKAMFEEENFDLSITVDDEESYQIQTNLLLLTLTSSVGGMENILSKDHLFDGYGHLYAFKGSLAVSSLMTFIEEKGLPSHEVDNDSLLSLVGKSFKLKANDSNKAKAIKANIDGDEGPILPLTIAIHAHALSIWVPKRIKTKA